MNLLRPLVVLVLIAVAVSLSAQYSEHHVGETDFITLFKHLEPARLVHGGGHGDAEEGDHEADAHQGEAAEHGEEAEHGATEEAGARPDHVLEIPLPGFMSFFDMHVEKDAEGKKLPGQSVELVFTNLQLFQITAALLILVCFWGVPHYIRSGKGDVGAKLFAGFAMWIRDEMVYPAMGRTQGNRFLPLFLCVFFFILFMNMLGLMPGAATATASIFVTGAMAAVTLSMMVVGGMMAQGPLNYWKNLVPHVPAPLWPLMFLVELIGVFVKPFALTIRLFANMTGGHLVVLSLMGVLFFFAANMGRTVGWVSSPIWVAFAAFIMIIEFFVAMLQAYIFTMLSILFVQASLHPEH